VRVSHLALDDFRSWKHGVVELPAGPTVLVGANGQGKTNLVEALAYLSTFSSHRVGAEGALVRIPIDEAEAGSAGQGGPAPVVVSPTLMRVGASDVHPYRGDFARAAADLTDLARDGWRIVVTTEGPGPGRRRRRLMRHSRLRPVWTGARSPPRTR